MNTIRSRLSTFVGSLLGVCGLFATASPALATIFPQYDHVFLILEENEGFNQIIGNKFAPILNALGANYGLATNYTGVADPSEPNYVAMLGGDTFGISTLSPTNLVLSWGSATASTAGTSEIFAAPVDVQPR